MRSLSCDRDSETLVTRFDIVVVTAVPYVVSSSYLMNADLPNCKGIFYLLGW